MAGPATASPPQAAAPDMAKPAPSEDWSQLAYNTGFGECEEEALRFCPGAMPGRFFTGTVASCPATDGSKAQSIGLGWQKRRGGNTPHATEGNENNSATRAPGRPRGRFCDAASPDRLRALSLTRSPSSHTTGNELQSEALPGALPVGMNNPKVCPYGLYAEQLSGTPFTVPRAAALRTWMYRTRPSVTHEPFSPVDASRVPHLACDHSAHVITPNQIRWRPLPLPSTPVDWVAGLHTVCGAGDPLAREGYGIHLYAATSSMTTTCLANADGDLLLVPQTGRLHVTTELGRVAVAPGEIIVLPRGVRFSVALPDGSARGYVLESYGGPFTLPDLGPVGANGLASARDFEAPTAWYEDRAIEGGFTVLHKFGGRLFAARQAFSPFNVVAWHGNLAPFKYELARFCPVNAVSFDHPDPSIFTVLTVRTPSPGVPVADFVVFPPRWCAAEGTFRPPYYHRNSANEFMGLIRGSYDAKSAAGFPPGAASLHLCMTPHGPDAPSYEAAVAADTSTPARLPDSGLAFMFETFATPRVAPGAAASPHVDSDYYRCWAGLADHFDAGVREGGKLAARWQGARKGG